MRFTHINHLDLSQIHKAHSKNNNENYAEPYEAVVPLSEEQLNGVLTHWQLGPDRCSP